jgi:CMP-N,N'-diacetyllegionaminic acid synthase
MIDNKRILAVIPARGGSKGIPYKNIVPINGKPLLTYTIEFVRQLNWIDCIHVSSDSKAILDLAENLGIINMPIRPSTLSGDLVGDIDVLKFALAESEKNQLPFDFILLLQPTSPLRSEGFILKCTNQLISTNVESVISIKTVDLKYNPLKQLIIDKNRLKYYDAKGAAVIARQQLVETFIRDGVFYGFKREFLLKSKSVVGDDTSFVINTDYSVNIDSVLDLNEFEKFLNENKKF